MNRTLELAGKISELSALLSQYHVGYKIPHPSFEESNWMETSYPANIEQTRMSLCDALRELNELVSGPRQQLQMQISPSVGYLNTIYQLKIADRVPKDGQKSYVDLAEEVGVDETALRRILRSAISNRLFMEKRGGYISHSAASRVLAEDQNVVDWLGFTLHEFLPAVSNLADALKKWPNADEPSETAFTLSLGDAQSTLFEYLDRFPSKAKEFAGTMNLFTKGMGYSMNHLVDNYPWADLGSGTIVDLGGSVGDIAFAVAEKFPDLHIIVQDLPNTIAAAKERPGSKVRFMAHDFFLEQPIKGADVYLCRWCFHDWPDKYAVTILKSLIPALKPGARVLIMDAIMPPVGVLPNIQERRMRALDCTMMALFNAKERDLEEWKALISLADSRYEIHEVKQPKGSNLALIDIVWRPDQV